MLSLFVYSTLGPNRPNAHIMEKIGGTWPKAHLFGTLKEQGWGAEFGFPGIVLDQSEHLVSGFVFFSDNLEQHWQELNEFEGTGYQRVPVKAYLSTCEVVDSYVYALNT
ncbi:gamma-glutamylcyclotransferase family protein [Acinetobacter modestus]|uniref:gamma-glutamylcyclotransferase family protein n=1 Tax=Acinetobacter modestus TaxID=1776740 RepID=UPI00320A3B7D